MSDKLRTQFEFREDIETLGAASIAVFAGNYHRLEDFELVEVDPNWPDGAELKWSGPYDPATVHPLFVERFVGTGFRPMLMIALGDQSDDPISIEANMDPCNNTPRTHRNPIIRHNAERVAQGLSPLSDVEFENMEGNDE